MRLVEQYSGAIAPRPLSLIATDERDTAPKNGNDQALDADSLAGSAEHGGAPIFARIGMLRALNRNVERTFDSSRKDTLGGSGSSRGTNDGVGGPRFGGESSRKIIEVRRQSKLIINPFP